MASNQLERIAQLMNDKPDVFKKYKFYEIGTKISKILENFIEKIKQAKKHVDDISKFKIVYDGKNDKGTDYFHFEIESFIFTCSNSGDRQRSASWGAVRQYLQVLTAAGFIFEDLSEPKAKNVKDLYVRINASKLKDDHLNDLFLNLLSVFKEDDLARNPRSDIFFSLLVTSMMRRDMLNEITYDHIRMRGSGIGRNKKVIDSIRSSLSKTYDRKIDGAFFKWINDNNVTPFEQMFWMDSTINIDKRLEVEKKIIFEEMAKRRSSARERLIQDRGYDENVSDFDISHSDKIFVNLLEAAHIFPYSKIKNEIEFLLCKIVNMDEFIQNRGEIDKLLNMIDDPNNLLLIPFNIHKMFDKGYLYLDSDFKFKIKSPNDFEKLKLVLKDKEYEISKKVQSYLIRGYIDLYMLHL